MENTSQFYITYNTILSFSEKISGTDTTKFINQNRQCGKNIGNLLDLELQLPQSLYQITIS